MSAANTDSMARGTKASKMSKDHKKVSGLLKISVSIQHASSDDWLL